MIVGTILESLSSIRVTETETNRGGIPPGKNTKNRVKVPFEASIAPCEPRQTRDIKQVDCAIFITQPHGAIFCNYFKSKFLKKECPGALLITKYLHSMIFPQFAVNNAFRSQGEQCLVILQVKLGEMKLN